MKDAYWFRHDSNARNDEKIIDLRGDLGYEGYGIYWAIIEFLRDTENYEAEFKPKRLAMVLQVSQDLIEQVISGYKLFQRDENGMFYSISLKSRMKEMDRKREVQRVKANLRWHPDGKQAKKDRESQSNATALPQECHKNKEDKIIEKEKTVENSRQDERVQGEKVNQIFISDCLEVRNAYPINLLFEYIFFIGNYKLESAEEYRANFINYWKRSGAEKNIRDIKKGWFQWHI
ncbi:Lin1244/Lin1753 domain-containing protein [Algoriphagus halophilus]|uniref:Lin1244/Lin1753 domain-containing protein n=1 Tax=Algoriphagus halophilus TaxID=226505 RepID=UPI00358F20E3